MHSLVSAGWRLVAAVVLLCGGVSRAAENTVAVCVTSTNPDWGQSTTQTWNWHTNMRIKDAPGYGVYDIEIGRSNNSVSYLSLYRFTDDVWDRRVEPWALAAFNAYKQSKLIRKIELINPNNLPYWDPAISAQVRDALKVFNTLIAEREPNPSRFVLCFLGHGAPWAFFEGAIQYFDSLDYMSHLRTSFPDSTIVGDFSTNCNNS